MLSPEALKQIRQQNGIQPISSNNSINTRDSFLASLSSAPAEVTKTREQQIAGQLNPVQNFGVGLVKGAMGTVKGLGTMGTKIAGGINEVSKTLGGSEILPQLKGQEILNPETIQGKQADAFLSGASTGQSLGIGTEKALEFFLPASQAAKAEEAVNIISQGISSPALASATRILGKAFVQGTASTGVSLAQTGGNIKESLKTGVTAGTIRGGMAVIGEGARALHIPERLYSTIFKNSARDMIAELKNNGIIALQKADPQKFQQFVEQGIIKVGEDGTPIVNDTLAEQALDRGLRGSIRNMANTVVHGALDSENQARQIAQNAPPVTISTKEAESIKRVLNDIAESHQDVAFGRVSDEAQKLADAIQLGSKNEVQIPANDILAIRRFFDARRIESSFNAPATKQSLGQQNYKVIADTLRAKLSDIPEMADVMKNYSFNIQALEALAKEAARRGNNQVISLIDSIFLGGGLSSENPSGLLTMGVLRKLLMSGRGMTGLGQAMNNSVAGAVQGGATGATASGLNNLLPSSQVSQ